MFKVEEYKSLATANAKKESNGFTGRGFRVGVWVTHEKRYGSSWC